MLWKDKHIYSLDIYDSWKSIISVVSATISRQDYIILVDLL